MTQNPEELFPPKPGGMVDTIRKQRDKDAAQLEASSSEAAMPDFADFTASVKEVKPDVGTARTVTLSSANPVLEILPADEKRYSAVILAADNDIYITNDQSMAFNVQGSATAQGAFYLPKNVPLPVDSKAQFFAACTTTANSSRVSVMVSKDSK